MFLFANISQYVSKYNIFPLSVQRRIFKIQSILILEDLFKPYVLLFHLALVYEVIIKKILLTIQMIVSISVSLRLAMIISK